MCIFRGGYKEEDVMCIKQGNRFVVNWGAIGAVLFCLAVPVGADDEAGGPETLQDGL